MSTRDTAIARTIEAFMKVAGSVTITKFNVEATHPARFTVSVVDAMGTRYVGRGPTLTQALDAVERDT